jgi:hypothetical protein
MTILKVAQGMICWLGVLGRMFITSSPVLARIGSFVTVRREHVIGFGSV